jgi:hypothetical protein
MNSSNIENALEHRFVATWRYLSKILGILEYEKHPVKVATAFLLSLLKFGKTDINHSHPLWVL